MLEAVAIALAVAVGIIVGPMITGAIMSDSTSYAAEALIVAFTVCLIYAFCFFV
ncbi:MAG TPA: hypothetical protein VKW04_18245 [Planctomycetota bacterium]|nr:hypothetical protein [Planctomycetota bacterium]